MLLAALALAATAQSGAQEPQGPPSTTPLTAQGDAPVPAAKAPLARASKPTDGQPIQAGPASGQSASGVTSYPASFFAPYQPNAADDMITRVPGFVFDDGTSVRGFAGAASNVIIDGQRPTSKSDDLASILHRIPAAQVERIDVIRGGAPGIDMQGKTVIANVVRKTAADSLVFAAANSWVQRDGRQAPALRLEGSHRADGTSFDWGLFGARFFDDGAGDGPEVRRDPSGAVIERLKDNTEGGGTQLTATAAYATPLFGGKFKINGQLFGQNYLFNELDRNRADSADQTLEHDHQNQEQSELGLTYTHSLGPKTSLESLFIQQFQAEDYLTLFNEPGELDRFREGHYNGESILRSTATYTYSKSLTFEVGGEGDYNFLNSRTSYVVNGAGVALPAANVQVTELRGEGFAKATWVLSPQWTLEGGLRFEASNIDSSGDVVLSKTLTYPKPRAVVTWSPTGADQFRLRVEEEVGQLDFNDFIASSSLNTGQIHTGNPNLEPQQATVIEAAYERRFWKSGDFSFTYRHSELTDVIDRAPVFDPAGTFDSPANIGAGTKDEYIATFTTPLDPFFIPGGMLKANYTYRHSRVTDPTTGEERPISGLRPLEGEIDFTQDLPQWKLSWGLSYYTGWRQPYYRFNQVEVDSFRQFGTAFIEYRPIKNLSIRGELNDIGADYRRDLTDYPDLRGAAPYTFAAQRNLYFGPVPYIRIRKTF